MRQINFKVFNSFEEQISYMKSNYSIYVPNVIAGQKAFFSDIYRWLDKYDENIIFNTANVIFSDPTLNLALPYPYDEIKLAFTNVFNKQPHRDEIENLFNEFSLNYELAKRPIISLSGGERLLLTFLKAYILEEISTKLIVCSPTQWLNPDKYRYLEKLLSKYLVNGKEVDYLLLQGELFPESITDIEGYITDDILIEKQNALPWLLESENVEVELTPIQFPEKSDSKIIKFITEGNSIQLSSPTLLLGDNGVGKSVFAKVLSGLEKCKSGYLKVKAGGSSGNARLLLQESIYQLFGESITNHFERIFKYDEEQKKVAYDIYYSLDSIIRDFVKINPIYGYDVIGCNENPSTLLQCKMALIAERIASKPPLLILDELDWSLSGPISKILFKAISIESYKNSVSLLIISHNKDWWLEIVNSIISMKLNSKNNAVEIFYEKR